MDCIIMIFSPILSACRDKLVDASPAYGRKTQLVKALGCRISIATPFVDLIRAFLFMSQSGVYTYALVQ